VCATVVASDWSDILCELQILYVCIKFNYDRYCIDEALGNFRKYNNKTTKQQQQQQQQQQR